MSKKLIKPKADDLVDAQIEIAARIIIRFVGVFMEQSYRLRPSFALFVKTEIEQLHIHEQAQEAERARRLPLIPRRQLIFAIEVQSQYREEIRAWVFGRELYEFREQFVKRNYAYKSDFYDFLHRIVGRGLWDILLNYYGMDTLAINMDEPKYFRKVREQRNWNNDGEWRYSQRLSETF